MVRCVGECGSPGRPPCYSGYDWPCPGAQCCPGCGLVLSPNPQAVAGLGWEAGQGYSSRLQRVGLAGGPGCCWRELVAGGLVPGTCLLVVRKEFIVWLFR